jgi:hypothetical protein
MSIIPYPYKKNFMNDPLWYMENLLKYKAIIIKATNEKYTELKSKKQYNYDIIVKLQKTDYETINMITDYFTEEERLKAIVKGQKYSPIEYWNNNWKELIKQTNDIKKLRDLIWKNGPKEATQFKITSAYSIFKYIEKDLDLNLSKCNILDPSSGWGDRLIMSIGLNFNKYVGYDPNVNLQKGYNEINTYFGKTNYKVIPEPFEDATLKQNFDFVFTSPPYFDVEDYTNDKNQSIKRYPNVDKWINVFFNDYITNAWNALKIGGIFMIHIADSRNLQICLYLNQLMDSIGAKKYKLFGIEGENFIFPVWTWKKNN